MHITSWLLLFGVGVAVGLFIPPFLKLLKFQIIFDLIASIAGLLVVLFAPIGRFFRRRNSKPKAQEVIEKPKPMIAQKMDPREERINNSAQLIRAILLNLAGLIQRTDQAAQKSSATLGDVRTTIDDMNLPPDLCRIHDLLIREIDRVISSNTTLKAELAISRESLEEQRQQIENLKTAVRVDGLTQLASRSYFEEKLAEMIQLRSRYKEPFSLLMMDVDNFKPINDTYGHQAGDRLLKGVAFKLKATVRESDFIARFGGDEFALILIKLPGEEAVEVGWKLCRVLEESRFLLDGRDFTITISIGVAEAVDGDTLKTLIKRADEALYLAKGEGRSRAVLAPR